MSQDWQLIATLTAAAATVVGVPLTAIVFYLKVIREGQRDFERSCAGRVLKVETECEKLEAAVEQAERRYTPRDEWMRETMLARTQLGRLTELIARLQAELESSRALATQFFRATQAIIQLTEGLGRRLAEDGKSQARGTTPNPDHVA